MGRVSIGECRQILEESADQMTDAEVEAVRDEYERIADVLFDQIVQKGKNGSEDARWDTHFRLTGEESDGEGDSVRSREPR